MMSVKKASRWYEFGVGRIELDIDGNPCVRTLDGKLHEMPSEDRDMSFEHMGFLCGFWINKKSKKLKNVGPCGKEPARLTESDVDFIWNISYGYYL